MTAAQMSTWVRRFSAAVASQASAVTVWIGPSPNRRPLPPATEKRPSIRPNRSTAAVTAASTSASSVNSACAQRGTQSLAELPGMLGGLGHDEYARPLADEPFRGGGGDAGRTGDEDDAIAKAVHARP